MTSDRTARAGLVALGVTNVVLLALLLSRSSAPSVGALGRSGLEQDFEAGHGRKLLASLVGEELADDPELFRRRLQQTFKYAHCFSEYSVNTAYLVMNCPLFIDATKRADSDQQYIPISGATFAVFKEGSPIYRLDIDGRTYTGPLDVHGPSGSQVLGRKVATIDATGAVQADRVQAQIIAATTASVQDLTVASVMTKNVKVVDDSGKVQVSLNNNGAVVATIFAANGGGFSVNANDKAVFTVNAAGDVTSQGQLAADSLSTGSAFVLQSLSVRGKTQFGDLEAANLAVTESLSAQGKTQFGDLAAANLAVGKALSVQGSAQFAGNVATTNLAVSRSLSVQGSTQFGNLAVANLNVTSLLRSTGKTQLSNLSIAALTVSGAASFGGDVSAAKSLRVLGNTALGTAGVTPIPLDIRGKFVAQDALLDNAVVKGEVQTRTMIASSNVAVRGDLWVNKDITSNGKTTARAGLVANTCSCRRA